MDRQRALPPSPLLGASCTGAGRQTGKMVSKYATIVYIILRLNASMIKQKKIETCGVQATLGKPPSSTAVVQTVCTVSLGMMG